MRNGRRAAGVLALGAVLVSWGAAAADTEVREFTVSVGGKPAGKAVMSMTRHDDGTETMTGQVEVTVRFLLFSHKYHYQGSEQWKDGRLLQLVSKTIDGKTRYEVQARAEGDGLRVSLNGKERILRWDVWTGSHWKLADKRFFNQAVPVLEVDSGKDFAGRLDYLGIVPVPLNGQPQNCHHFRLTGGQSPVDLWYDGAFRLVRQEFNVDKHRLEVQLSGLRRQ